MPTKYHVVEKKKDGLHIVGTTENEDELNKIVDGSDASFVVAVDENREIEIWEIQWVLR